MKSRRKRNFPDSSRSKKFKVAGILVFFSMLFCTASFAANEPLPAPGAVAGRIPGFRPGTFVSVREFLNARTREIMEGIVLPAKERPLSCPREIIRRMEENLRGDSSYNEMTMETIRPRYRREISMKSWVLGDDYALVYITAPARDRGTGFLKRGNEMWNYQPNIDRTVKMPPSMMSQSWMGSDFTNDDLVGVSSLVEDYRHSLLGSETFAGFECYLIELIPEPETPVVYEKVKYWVEKTHLLPVKVRNYGERDELVSTVYFSGVEEIDGRKIPTVMEMVPEDRENHSTVITIHEARFDIDISRDFFSIRNLTDMNL